jgi:hypothetical protein
LEEATTLVAEDDEAVRDYRKVRNQIEKQLTEALRKSAASLFENERADLVRRYSEQYRFFHYELEFIEVFRERNGFDIAVGNPPWLKATFEEKNIIAEIFPEVLIRRMSGPDIRNMQSDFLNIEIQQKLYFIENIESESLSAFLNAYQNYPLLKGQQSDLYKCFVEHGFNWINENGFLGLIHPESLYTDARGEIMREVIYKHLKYHFQFVNNLLLFSEVDSQKPFGIHIYSGKATNVLFYNINNLFHPSTIDLCLVSQNTNSSVGGIKVKNKISDSFEWNIQPHPSRCIKVTEQTLRMMAQIFENSTEWSSTKLVSIHANEVIQVIDKIGAFPNTVADLETKITVCWDETIDVNSGFIKELTKFPDFDALEMIYSGPHIFVGNPLYKSPKMTCTHNSHYDVIDLCKINEYFIARTNFVPTDTIKYIDKLSSLNFQTLPYHDWLLSYKLGFRKMIGPSRERTLNTGIIPPKMAHTYGVISVVFSTNEDFIELAALTSSIIYDFFIKTLAVTNLTKSRIEKLPIGIEKKYKDSIKARILLLNCITIHYKKLWEESFRPAFTQEEWSVDDARLKFFTELTKEWNWNTPLRNYFERRMALVEIDVISAMALGLSLNELITIYNIQFPILQQNEDDTWYDAQGNIVFTCSEGLVGVGLDRPNWERIKDMSAGETYEHTITKSELYFGDKVTYHAPFTKCDRVEDYKRAWQFFEEKFKLNPLC